MARVDFAFGAADRLRMACAVTQKHYLAGRRLVVYTQDLQRLALFDRLLWGFEATAFVPHVMADDALASDTPVVLTSSMSALAADGSASRADDTPAGSLGEDLGTETWLLNLDLACPTHLECYPRVLEIVSDHDDDKRAARERWRQYQAAGHTLHAHDVSGRTPGQNT